MDPLPNRKVLDPHFLTRKMLTYEQGLPLALRLTVHSNSTSAVKITGLTKDSVFSFEMTPVGDLTQEVQTFQLTDFPIWLSIVTDDDTLVRGDVYAKVELMIRETPHGTLAQGYVYSLGAPSWPNGNQEDSFSGRGKIVSITGAIPSASAEIAEAVPANLLWRLLLMRFTFATSAIAANRIVHIILTDGTNVLLETWTTPAITANQTNSFSVHPVNWDQPSSDANEFTLHMPPDILLPAGFVIGTDTNQGQAGDQFSAIFFLVEQWILPS